MRAAGSGATPTLIGIAAGVPLALAAGRILRDQLWIAPTDWSTIVLVAGLMAAVALAAAIGPAIQAMRLDPAVVLKHDADA